MMNVKETLVAKGEDLYEKLDKNCYNRWWE